MGCLPTPCTTVFYCSFDFALIRRQGTILRHAFWLLLTFLQVIFSRKKLVQVLEERQDGAPGEVTPVGFRNDDPVVVKDSDVFLLCGCFPKLDYDIRSLCLGKQEKRMEVNYTYNSQN